MSIRKNAIRAYIIENFLFGEDDGLQNDSSFLEKAILDSTGVLELVAYLEGNFGIKVADDELTPENLDSIDLIDAYLERKLPANA